jgi:hypothetical protein
MVCHLTDGQYTGSDPEPIAQEIMQMSNYDGNVLVENIYIGSEFTRRPISDIEAWPGVLDRSDLKSQYAQQLFDMSSPLPDRYASVINEEGYELRSGSRMLLPGTNYDLIELAFAISGATPISGAEPTSKQPDILSRETIFIAYSRKDWDDFVEPLVAHLRNHGFKVWLDHYPSGAG